MCEESQCDWHTRETSLKNKQKIKFGKLAWGLNRLGLVPKVMQQLVTSLNLRVGAHRLGILCLTFSPHLLPFSFAHYLGLLACLDINGILCTLAPSVFGQQEVSGSTKNTNEHPVSLNRWSALHTGNVSGDKPSLSAPGLASSHCSFSLQRVESLLCQLRFR